MASIAAPGPRSIRPGSRPPPLERPELPPAGRMAKARFAAALLATGALLHACGKESSPDRAGAGTVLTKLTIATVNNGDMIRMQGLTSDFTARNPGIPVEWVTLEENVLRQKVTTDIATQGG